ncbi:MAG TPA: DUF6754 domain-containing protein [Chloroflexia bacterium]|nr:DUF6754 domain-containing protein [Chloroflexia bacterium]
MSLIAGGLAFLILLIFVLAILLLTARVRAGRVVTLRPLPGFAAAREAIGRAAEQGRTTHLSAGPGTVGDNTGGTAETLAGLDLMGRTAQRCAAAGTPVLATTGGALAFPLAENQVRAGFATVGRLSEVPLIGAASSAGSAATLEGRAQGVRMLAHRDPMAYAAAAADLSECEGVSNAVLVGSWGPEYLLVNEGQARSGIHSVAGAVDPQALATMMLGANHTLLGEEIYAGGAYLDANPSHLASLLAQDTVRLLIILLILVGTLLATAGFSVQALLGVAR